MLLQPLLDGEADAVFGSRMLDPGAARRGGMPLYKWLGNRVLTGMCRLLYGVAITDLMTCYKMYRSRLIEGLAIDANGFDFEGEFTARLVQRKARLREVPVSFRGRTIEEGKKIRAFDAARVSRRLLACKFTKERTR